MMMMMLLRRAGVLVLLAATALPLSARAPRMPVDAAELSRRITTIAADLFEAEKKVAERWSKAETEAEPEGEAADEVDGVMYDDVTRMLDSAIEVDPDNMRAHALLAEVLLRKAYEGQRIYNVCSLLDAQDEAQWVIAHSAQAGAPDLKKARDLIKAIKAIPKESIPDPPGSCDDDDDSHHRSATVKT
jgi:hypothetical protein